MAASDRAQTLCVENNDYRRRLATLAEARMVLAADLAGAEAELTSAQEAHQAAVSRYFVFL
jgi:hypothetical protein